MKLAILQLIAPSSFSHSFPSAKVCFRWLNLSEDQHPYSIRAFAGAASDSFWNHAHFIQRLAKYAKAIKSLLTAPSISLFNILLVRLFDWLESCQAVWLIHWLFGCLLSWPMTGNWLADLLVSYLPIYSTCLSAYPPSVFLTGFIEGKKK